MRPVIALAMGDPAAISPELTAKLLALDEVIDKARIVVIGDRRVLDDGARIAAVKLDLGVGITRRRFSKDERAPTFIDLGHLDPASVTRSTATAEGGRFALTNYRHALTMGRDGRVDAVCFTPFNKNAMRLAHPVYDDEISFSTTWLGLTARRANSTYWTGCGTHASPRIFHLRRSRRISPGARPARAARSQMPRCARPDSSVRASRSPASTPMPAMAEISGGKRSTRSDPRWNKPALTGSRDRRSVSRRYRVPARQKRRIRRGADDVS